MKGLLIIWLLAFQIDALSQNHDSTSYTSRETKGIKLLLRSHILRGDSAQGKGDLPLAEKEYKLGYALIEPVLRMKTSHRISTFNETIFDPIDRLGYLYVQTNNLTKAELYFESSRKLRDVHLPKKSLFRVPPLVGLCQVFFQRGDYAKAREFIDKAEKLYNASMTGWYNYDHYGKAIYTPKFEIALIEKNYKEAERYLARLSSGATITNDQNVQANIPRVFDMRARYFLHSGDYLEAEKNLKKGELFSEAIANEQVRFQLERTRALLEWSQKNISKAAESFIKLTNRYKEYISENFAAMTEYEREGFFEKLRTDFDLFNAFAIQNSKHAMAPLFFQEVYNNQLFSKALLLNHINKQRDLIHESGNEKLIDLLAEWEGEKANLASLYYQKKTKPNQIENAEGRIQELEGLINAQSEYLNAMDKKVTWEQVRDELRSDESAIEIIRVRNYNLRQELEDVSLYQFTSDYSYLSLIVSKDSSSPDFLLIPNGNEKEGRQLKKYRNSILHKIEDNSSYDTYWRPFRKFIEDRSRIFISADGVYNQININSLRNPNHERYVLDETNLIFVTNTKDLVKSSDRNTPKKAALFGRPKYLIGEDLDVNIEGNSSELRSLESKVFDGFREQVFIDLPGTENEVKSIEGVLEKREWTVEAHYGLEASESNLKSLSGPGILHIATHGFFLEQDNFDGVNSMIRSGIILSGVDKQNTTLTDDGVLTAYEATNLKLDSTYLVVLSACETGLGEVKNGEGVYGLQRGFAVAGVRFLLMSLWKVDDVATQRLMQDFYLNWLAGMKIHEAFKEAQISLRKDYPHPFYWGAFVLLGN